MCEKLTDAQSAEVKDVFMQYANDRGQLSVKDLGTAMRTLGQNPTQAELEAWVTEVDPRKKGSIDVTAFLALMAGKMTVPAITEAEVVSAFRMFDPVGRGTISTAELRQVLTVGAGEGEGLGEEEMEALVEAVRAVGRGGGGEVEYETFVREMMKE